MVYHGLRIDDYIDGIGVITIIMDRNANISLINQEGCRLLEYEQEELIGKNWIQLVIPPEIREEVWEIFYKLIDNNFSEYEKVAEHEVITRTGKRLCINWTNSLIKNKEGKILAIFSSGKDVTEQRKVERIILKKREWYRILVNSINDAIFVYETSDDNKVGKTTSVNDAACEMLGYTQEELLAMTPIEIDGEQALQALEKKGAVVFENSLVKKDGSQIPVEISTRLFNFDEKHLFLSIARDITERKLAEAKLKASEARFRQVVENIREVLWLTDLETEQILYVNPAYEAIWGRTCQSLYDNPGSFIDSVHPDDKKRIIKAFKNVWLKGENFDQVYRIVLPNEEIKWVYARALLVNNNGDSKRLVGIAEDITLRKEMEEKLNLLAMTDALTGINNRYSFFEKGEKEVLRYQRYQRPLAVLMIDIDNFKKFNDTYGHATGDVVLKELAANCSQRIRKTDIIGRIGGEEFAIILVETNKKQALAIGEKLRISIEQMKVRFGEGELKFTVSIGITVSQKSDNSLENLLKRADAALYEAKKRGRNRCHFV